MLVKKPQVLMPIGARIPGRIGQRTGVLMVGVMYVTMIMVMEVLVQGERY
jgi:hypothetical protein